MALDRSTLQVDPDFNALTLRVDQRPLLAWAALTNAAIMGLLFSMLIFGLVGVSPLVLLTAAAAFAMVMFSRFWTRPASFTLGPSQLLIAAWTGTFARRRVHRVPLAGLEITSARSSWVYGAPTHELVLVSPGEAPIRVGGLFCDEADLERLRTEIAAAQAGAVARIGAGVDEIPAELHAVRGEPRAERI